MSRRLNPIPLLILLFLLFSFASRAAETPSFQTIPSILGAPLGSSQVTNLQVLREIFPDLSPEGKYTRMKARRHEVDTMDVSGNPGAANQGEGIVDQIQGYIFSQSENTYAVILSIPSSVLILAQIAPQYRFLDAIDVGQDVRANITDEVGFLSLGSGAVAFDVVSAHLNAGEEYRKHLLIGVMGEKLKGLYDGPFLYSFLEPGNSTRSCRVEQRLQKPGILPMQHGGYNDLKMTVVERRLCGPDPGREKVVSQRTYSATLTWDPVQQKYLGEMKDLSQLNRKRMGM